MGASRSHELKDKEQVKELCDETGFSEKQIQRFFDRFVMLDKGKKGYLSSYDLLRLPELGVNPLGERIVMAMYKEETAPMVRDRQTGHLSPSRRINLEDVKIPFRSFVRCFARFRHMSSSGGDSSHPSAPSPAYNTVEGKLRFLFRMFDIMDDGHISIAEIFALLKVLSPKVNDEDLIRFSQEIMMEATPKEFASTHEWEYLEEIRFKDFCSGNDRERLVKDMYFRFAGE